MGRIFTSFLLLLILLLVMGVAVLNSGEPKVNLHFYFGSFYGVPLVLALFLAFLLGSVLTFLYLLVHTIKLQLRVRDLKARTKQYEKELIALRNIPVVGEDEVGSLSDDKV